MSGELLDTFVFARLRRTLEVCGSYFSRCLFKVSVRSGFTFFEVIMAIVISGMGLTLLMTTQGSLVKQSARIYASWQAVVALKNSTYQARWAQALHPHKEQELQPKHTDQITISFNQGPVPLNFLISKNEKELGLLVYTLSLVKVSATWNFFGITYDLVTPLVLRVEKKQKESAAQGKQA